MPCGQVGLTDFQRLAMDRFSFLVATGGLEQRSQIVEASGDVEMKFCGKAGLPDFQRLAKERLGFVVATS